MLLRMIISKNRIKLAAAVLVVGLLLFSAAVQAAPCDIKPGAAPFIQHDLSNSYCELCGYGYITIVVTNPYAFTRNRPSPDIPGATMTAMTVEENLGISGLSFASGAPNPVTYRVNNGIVQSGSAPGTSGSTLAFTSFQIPPLDLLEAQPGINQFNTITITFAVTRTTDPEGLLDADRTIQSTLTFSTDAGCSDSPQSDQDTLPLREPLPQVIKTGWNYDAGQRQNSESNPVYGNNDDDVVWRIRIDNNGLAGLQDLRFDDLMQSGSVVISDVCATEASADTIAGNNGLGTAPGCEPADNNIGNFLVTDPYGDMGLSLDGYEIDVAAGGSASIYLVGKISGSGSCETSKTNTVDNVQWGCEEQAPAGDIIATSTGIVPTDVAAFYSLYNNDHPLLTVERRLTGTNTSQPVGSKGTMTLIIRNNSGGSVKNIHLKNELPLEYVVDPTFPPELVVTPAYGAAYDGMVDTLVWTNEDTLVPLGNTIPEFDLTSDGATHPIYTDQVNMLRHGDVAVVRFRVVLIESDYYDRNANLDVNPEEFQVTVTDPNYQTPLSNRLTVDFDLFCPAQGSQTLVLDGNGTGNPSGTEIPAFPEDLDIAVGGIVFILTNDPDQLLTLPILLTNNGGHDAADYHAFVSFGATMEVVNAPIDCRPTSLSAVNNQPDPWKVWIQPAPIPATATVYECSSTTAIPPGRTVTLEFDVRKSLDLSRVAIDDLSLRADVVGEIILSDDTPLWFPPPITRPDGELDRTNNYSMDATWARVIGFNLKKNQIGTCNENLPPSYDTNGFEEVQVGEECLFQIETGGWFGFRTPGYAYIAVQNIDVTDEVPDGQAYLSSTAPDVLSTSLIENVTLNPVGLSALDEGWFDWRFNVPDNEQIRVADEWFVVDTKTRLLNKPVDQRLAPNVHAENSHNVLNSVFDATFKNDNTGLVEKYTLGPDTVGYPNEAIRRVDLTVTEPFITLVKEVCNETLYGAGAGCSNFVALTDEGDAYSSYVYRITLSNEESSDDVLRAPAYDVIVTDQLDDSDLAYVFPFDGDGLDNDGDGASGGSDTDGEGTNLDNIVKNGVAAQLTFSYTHSTALQRIDPGQSVELFYRVDYDDDAAPLQTFTNTAEATYDSLTGEFGVQSVPQGSNGELGGARVYTSDPVSASVQLIPVLTRPKSIVRISNTPLLAVPGTQEVSIGEELEYQLNTLLPVALLRDFVISDQLPAGLICAEAPDVNLDEAPYTDAGFEPGGIITPTCTDDLVAWDFGDQRLTIGTGGSRYDFAIRFMGRVVNTEITNNDDPIANGHPATVTTVAYVDEDAAPVSYDFGQVDIVVREPLIDLTKAFNVAEADADDTLTVTVTATNSGTAPAYNLRVLDDLEGLDLTYVGNVGGADPPDNVDLISLGPDRPIFSWNAPNGIDIAAGISFTFDISVNPDVQPLQLLSNTIQADWTSLPDQTTALNSSGTIGVDGSTTGMRNGSLPNSSHAVNDYEATTDSQLTVPALALTKTDLTPAGVPAIGAHRPFRIDIALPEGISNNVTVIDSLDAAGLSYLLANNAGFDISYSFEGILSINDQPPAEAAFTSFPADGTSGDVSWEIGTVVTQTEDDTIEGALNPVIRIDYYARVNNDLDTDAGDPLQNGVVANYLNGATGEQETLSDTTPAVVVSEPDLILTKTLANVTAGKNPADPPMVGDLLEYRLTAINTGSSNSTAHDINIVDTLPVGLVLDAGFIPTATIDSVAVAGFVATPSGAPAGPLVWGRDNADASLDLPAGQVLVVTYQTLVQRIADPAGLIENGVWSDWTSLTDVSPYERTGDGCPVVTAPDDYCVGPVFATTTGIAPELVFQKLVVNETSGLDPGVNANPGDTLRYRLQVTNISTAPGGFSVIDELDRLNDPPLFVPGTLTIIGGHGGTDASDPNGGAAGTGLVDIRDLDLDGGESLTIEFTVQLAAVIADSTLVLNQAELMLSGRGSINSDDPTLAGDEDPTQTLIVSSPAWRELKSVQDLTGASTILFAGDLLRYTIALKNNGTENATDVVLRDPMPANTTYIAESTTLNGVPVADPTPGVSPLETGLLVNAPEDPTAGVMRADVAEAADNEALVSFQVQVNADTASGTIISNQGFVNGSGDESGTFPEQPSDDPATIAIDDPTLKVVSTVELRKSVFNETSGGDGATATPGDVLRYRLEVVNTGSIALNDLSLVDALESLQPDEPLLFVAGTLALITVPVDADVTATDPFGGNKGTGLVDVRDLSAAPGETLTIEFTVRLAPVITSGTLVLNQAELSADGQPLLLSDDADPAVDGDEDPTATLISSAPLFEVLKTSTILSGDPTVLLAGETLRYTLTIRNLGSEDAVSVLLQDYTPDNTSYLANSTSLNGVGIADAVPGINPLHSGIPVNAPGDDTPGSLHVDVTLDAAHMATVTFDVVVAVDAMDGLIIENQGFVRGSGTGSGQQPEQPSDDPATPAVDDPTRNVVGNLPLLYAQKTVAIAIDGSSAGIVDPGDVLLYTITVSNTGAIPATGVTLTDNLPVNTSYVEDSLRLNGLATGPDGGVLPLIAGLPVNSDDTPGDGIISANASAEITFELEVNVGVPVGTLISNQGTVSSAELVPGLTDADGLASNGFQPTVVVVGDVQLLALTKDVTVVNGGSAEPGAELAYELRVTNISGLPASRVVVTDDLSPPLGDMVTYMNGSGTLNGIAAGVSYAANLLTADYAATYGNLAPGASLVVRFNVLVNPMLERGTTITNTGVVNWDDPQRTASAAVSLDVGGTPGSAALSGQVWHDASLETVYDADSEQGQQGWLAELYLDDQLVTTVTTDENGLYQFTGLLPTASTNGLYEIRFFAADAGVNTPSLGYTDSPFTDGPQQITEISVVEGSNLQNLNLPLWPNGILYDSVARRPIAGVTLTMRNATSGRTLPGQCFDDLLQQNQVTNRNGFYKFDLNFSDAECPAGGSYLIEVTAPTSGYLETPSVIIPPTSDAATEPFSVPTCPGSLVDAIPGTLDFCEAVDSAEVPPFSVGAGSVGTTHYLHLVLNDGSVPGHSQIFNNPIPIDPELDGAVAITKTAALTNVTKSSLVPYTITVTNVFGVPLEDIRIVDLFPAGFKYVSGSALLDGDAVEPVINGRELIWEGLELDVNEVRIIKLLLVVGSGVSEGEYVNRARVFNTTLDTPVSGQATATVRVIPDPDFDCTDVIGKVYDDRNLNGLQDDGEQGLSGVRIATARGLIATTDEFGRYHITCAVVPDENRGSNFIMKLDDHSLPSGFRVVTENPRVQRATRGKMMRFNFGATLHRVVTIDVADGVFEPDSTQLRLQWRSKIDQLLAVLKDSPSVLRLSYLADTESEGMVRRRLKAMKLEIAERWDQAEIDYRLTIETEVFWRRGRPVLR
jgi:uncharacterized repeat protein (TIGR01451 family)